MSTLSSNTLELAVLALQHTAAAMRAEYASHSRMGDMALAARAHENAAREIAQFLRDEAPVGALVVGAS